MFVLYHKIINTWVPYRLSSVKKVSELTIEGAWNKKVVSITESEGESLLTKMWRARFF